MASPVTVATLVAKLRADTGAFRSGMRRAAADVETVAAASRHSAAEIEHYNRAMAAQAREMQSFGSIFARYAAQMHSAARTAARNLLVLTQNLNMLTTYGPMAAQVLLVLARVLRAQLGSAFNLARTYASTFGNQLLALQIILGRNLPAGVRSALAALSDLYRNFRVNMAALGAFIGAFTPLGRAFHVLTASVSHLSGVLNAQLKGAFATTASFMTGKFLAALRILNNPLVRIGLVALATSSSFRNLGQRVLVQIPILRRFASEAARTAYETDKASRSTTLAGRAMGTFGMLAAKAFAGIAAAATSAIALGMRGASLYEGAMMAFTNMLGSASEAQAFLAEMEEFAKRTPFELPGLIEGARRLQAMGFAAEEVMPTLTAVGDVAASMGMGQEAIEGITRQLGQMRARGRVAAEELNVLADYGINGYELMAEKLQVTTQEVRKMGEQGRLTSEDFFEAFMNYEGPLERARGMMAQQAKTLAGMMSTLKDTVAQSLREMVTPLQATLGQALPAFTKMVEQIFEGIRQPFANLVGQIVVVMNTLMPIVEPIATDLANAFTVALEAIQPVIAGLAPQIAPLAKMFADLVVQASSLVGPLTRVFIAFAPIIVQIGRDLVNALNELLPSLVILAGTAADLAIVWQLPLMAIADFASELAALPGPVLVMIGVLALVVKSLYAMRMAMTVGFVMRFVLAMTNANWVLDATTIKSAAAAASTGTLRNAVMGLVSPLGVAAIAVGLLASAWIQHESAMKRAESALGQISEDATITTEEWIQMEQAIYDHHNTLWGTAAEVAQRIAFATPERIEHLIGDYEKAKAVGIETGREWIKAAIASERLTVTNKGLTNSMGDVVVPMLDVLDAQGRLGPQGDALRRKLEGVTAGSKGVSKSMEEAATKTRYAVGVFTMWNQIQEQGEQQKGFLDSLRSQVESAVAFENVFAAVTERNREAVTSSYQARIDAIERENEARQRNTDNTIAAEEAAHAAVISRFRAEADARQQALSLLEEQQAKTQRQQGLARFDAQLAKKVEDARVAAAEASRRADEEERVRNEQMQARAAELAASQEAANESTRQAVADLTAEMERQRQAATASMAEINAEMNARMQATEGFLKNMETLGARYGEDFQLVAAAQWASHPEMAEWAVQQSEAAFQPFADTMIKAANFGDITDNFIGTMDAISEAIKNSNIPEEMQGKVGEGVAAAVDSLNLGKGDIERLVNEYASLLTGGVANPLLRAVGKPEIHFSGPGTINTPTSTPTSGGPSARAEGYLPDRAVIQPATPNLVQWAEPETQGEAFIPLAPSKRQRSTAIWAETGRRLGVLDSFANGMVTGDLQGLHPEFMRRLSDFASATGPFHIGSGYRSLEEQARLYARYKAGVKGQAPAAPPGRSNHNFGLAADGPRIGGGPRGRAAAAFGLTYPMSYEPWHIEPVGAKGMRGTHDPNEHNGYSGAETVFVPPPPALPNQGSFAVGGGAIMDHLYAEMQDFAAHAFDAGNLDVPAAPIAGLDPLAPPGTPAGNKNLGQQALARRNWMQHWPALHELWNRESGWRNTAQNPRSTAYGIAQFLDSTWAGTGVRKTSDPAQQIEAGLRYIERRPAYGDPSAALRFWHANHWYGSGGIHALASGGIVTRPTLSLVGEAGPEAVIPLQNGGVMAAGRGPRPVDLGALLDFFENQIVPPRVSRASPDIAKEIAELTKAVQESLDKAAEVAEGGGQDTTGWGGRDPNINNPLGTVGPGTANLIAQANEELLAAYQDQVGALRAGMARQEAQIQLEVAKVERNKVLTRMGELPGLIADAAAELDRVRIEDIAVSLDEEAGIIEAKRAVIEAEREMAGAGREREMAMIKARMSVKDLEGEFATLQEQYQKQQAAVAEGGTFVPPQARLDVINAEERVEQLTDALNRLKSAGEADMRILDVEAAQAELELAKQAAARAEAIKNQTVVNTVQGNLDYIKSQQAVVEAERRLADAQRARTNLPRDIEKATLELGLAEEEQKKKADESLVTEDQLRLKALELAAAQDAAKYAQQDFTNAVDATRLAEINLMQARQQRIDLEEQAKAPGEATREAQEKLNELLEEQNTIGLKALEARAALTEAEIAAMEAEMGLVQAGIALNGLKDGHVAYFEEVMAAAGLGPHVIDRFTDSVTNLNNAVLGGTGGNPAAGPGQQAKPGNMILTTQPVGGKMVEVMRDNRNNEWLVNHASKTRHPFTGEGQKTSAIELYGPMRTNAILTGYREGQAVVDLFGGPGGIEEVIRGNQERPIGYARGGVFTRPTTTLGTFAERGPEIISPQSMMRDTVMEAFESLARRSSGSATSRMADSEGGSLTVESLTVNFTGNGFDLTSAADRRRAAVMLRDQLLTLEKERR